MNDEFFQAGVMVSRMLTKRDRRVSNEVVMCNTKELYLTIESRVSLNDEIHTYICRYAKKDHQNVALMTMKTFVVSVVDNGDEPRFGINTQSGTCDLNTMMKCVNWLCDAYVCELDKIKRGVYLNDGVENIEG